MLLLLRGEKGLSLQVDHDKAAELEREFDAEMRFRPLGLSGTLPARAREMSTLLTADMRWRIRKIRRRRSPSKTGESGAFRA